MSASMTHLIKLSVGSESVDSLAEWQETARLAWPDKTPRHVTRMWPKREAEIVNGGSIYWVIRGQVQARQRILRLEEVRREDGIRRCAIVLDRTLVRVEPAQKRAFQGWRYLAPEDAPADLRAGSTRRDSLPPDLQTALADIGLR